MSPPKQVNMQMRNRFASMRSVVYDDSEAVGKVFGVGDLGGGQKKVAEKSLIIRRGGANAGNRFFRNQQNVGGCLGRDVAECQA